jgi:ferredoxin
MQPINQMPRDAFQRRAPENVPGKFYVSDQCLDCDLCRNTAPTVFARNDTGGYSYVRKQPETVEELTQVRECIQCCCVETIYDDGDTFDWQAIPAEKPYYLTPEGQALRANLERKSGSCCRENPKHTGTNDDAT